VANRVRTRKRFRPRKLSCSSSTAAQKPDGYGKLEMELEWIDSISQLL
jgi:hypothetical protein